eukprot:6278324-Prymnesium_polylepis.1
MPHLARTRVPQRTPLNRPFFDPSQVAGNSRGALAGESVAQLCPEADAQEAGEGSTVTAVARSLFHLVRG